MEKRNPKKVSREGWGLKFISRVSFSDRLTFANNSQMAATVRTQLLWAGSAGNSCLFNCSAGHYLFTKMFLHTSVRFVTPENKLRRPAWCQLWLLYFWKIPDVSVCTPGDCWCFADSVWTHAPPNRSLNMNAVYFKLGVSLIVLIFDNIDRFSLQHQALLDHFLKQSNCWSTAFDCSFRVNALNLDVTVIKNNRTRNLW